MADIAVAGACGELIQSIDWRRSALGPMSGWPASLRAMVADMLHAKQPMLLFWGPELIQFYNDAFVPSFGQGKHPAAMGQAARECWQDAWPIVGAQIEAVMSRGEPAWHEDALVPIHRNGRMEEVFWTYSYSPAFDDDARIQGTLVIVTEVTGRVVSARRLEALAALGKQLAAATDDAAVFDDLAEAASGRPQDHPFVLVCERRGADSSVLRAIGIEAAGAAPAVLQALSASPEPREIELISAVAAGVWPEPVQRVFVVPLHMPERGGQLALLFGLSPRLPFDHHYRSYLQQMAEQVAAALGRIESVSASRAAERQRDELLMHAPVAAALLAGPDHVFQLANAPYQRLVGRDPTGQSFAEAFPELAGTPTRTILDRIYQTGERYTMAEQLIPLDRSGTGQREDCYFNVTLEPLRGGVGAVYGMMAIAVDITEQVRARQALEKIDADRLHVMAELERASRAKDEFLAMLGHELRNPLAPIVTALELMKQKETTTPREQAMIERQVHHVIRLVDDLLDVSKITRGKIALDRRPVDLSAVVDKAAEIASQLFVQRGHHLTLDVPGGLYVHADEGRLAQVFANLLTNAARYTPPGGDVRVGADVDGDVRAVTVRVTDTGVGMEPELRGRVFDLFVQGDRGSDRAEGGLGIGLALVKNLVALHGGSVSAHSEGPGKGSTFAVQLGLVDPPDVSPPEPSPPVLHLARASRRVLVVDDNEDAAMLLGELIRMVGHEVEIVHDPAAALQIADGFAPEIAVLDIGLPGMDGYELATRLRTVAPRCRLVALTGYGQEKDRHRTRQAGFEAHFVKPVPVDTLLRLFDAAPA
jgi:signal transduction histidine kinase/CheY-like chemotaxis protein